MFAGGFPQIACRGGRSVDVAVASYVAAAAANGGTVSAGRQTLLTTLINASMDLDHWWNTDDIALLTTEDAGAALTTLKRNALMTVTAAPTFTVDRGYAFNGTTQYVNTGFVPSTMAVQMTGTRQRVAVYERTNVASNGWAMGASDTATTRVSPRLAAGTTMGTALGTGTATFTVGTDSRGLTATSRPAGTTYNGWKNGVALTDVTGTPEVNTLVAFALYIGGRNNSGTFGTARASTIGEVEWGAPLPGGTTSELAWYNALQIFMTAIGANV